MSEKSAKDEEIIFTETEFEENHKPKKLKEKLIDLYYDSVPLFNANVAWFLFSLPLVTILPALGGLYEAVLHYNRNKTADWKLFWLGVKKNWILSLKWGGTVLSGYILIALNIWFSLNINAAWSDYSLVVGVVIGLIWSAINQFSFPLLLLQEEKRILLAIRNGYVIVVRQPWDALKVLLLNLLITAVSIIIPPLWVFVTMSLILHIQTRTAIRAVEKIRTQDADPETQEMETEPSEEQ